jgi:hypothetical protein
MYPDHVYKLSKALYGLKQAPRAWYECLRDILIANAFKVGKVDPTLLTKTCNDEDITSIHTMNGPITRSCARRLNLQVCSTLVNCVSELTLGAIYVLMIRNLGEDHKGLGKGQGVEE